MLGTELAILKKKELESRKHIPCDCPAFGNPKRRIIINPDLKKNLAKGDLRKI